MFLQILPPDFQYATEPTMVNKAEIISFVILFSVIALAVCVRILKEKKPNFFSEVKYFFNFITATLRKDFKIN